MLPSMTHRSSSSSSSGGNAPTTTVTKSFSFTAYSLASAVLMGSSIGLAIFQNHQLWFLNGLLTFPSSSWTTTARSTTEPSMPTATATATLSAIRAMATAFMTGLWHFVSCTVSAWIPLLVWFLSLLISALWTHHYFARSRSTKDHPSQQCAMERRVFTPRTAILASHVLFSFFWVILATVQEVEEQRTRSSRGGRTKIETTSQGHDHPPHVAQTPATTTTSSTTTMMLTPGERQALALANASHGSIIVYPLCIVWLSAIVLLGVATGLLTSSSAVLEDRASCLNGPDDKSDSNSAGPEGAISNTAKMQRHDEKDKEPAAAAGAKKDGQEMSLFIPPNSATTTISTTTPLAPPPLVGLAGFSWAQRATLFLLLQLLLSALMPFYQWMLRLDRVLPPSLPSSKSFAPATWLSTSSAMTLFGVFLGTLMVGLGRRFIPADPIITPFRNAHRHL